MPDLISSVHMRNIAFSSIKDQVEKEKKTNSKETKNEWSHTFAFQLWLYSTLICLKLFVDTEGNEERKINPSYLKYKK